MKYNVLIPLTLLACCSLFSTTTMHSQNNQPVTIHVINILDYISDYSDQNGYAIRYASDEIKSYVQSKMAKVANKVNAGQLKVYDIFDKKGMFNHNPYRNPEKNKFSKVYLLEEVEKMDCEGDVVVVVYNGHGFTNSQSKTFMGNNGRGITYPNLVLHYDPPTSAKHYLAYDELLCKIQKKKPAMVLSIVSACQEKISNQVEGMMAFNTSNPNSSTVDSLRDENFGTTQEYAFGFERASANAELVTNPFQVNEERTMELFNPYYKDDYRQAVENDKVISIELLSCSKGEFTWVDAEGGHFLTSFMDALDQALDSPIETSWEYVASNTYEITRRRVSAYNLYASTKGGRFDEHVQSPQTKVFFRTEDCNETPIARPLPRIPNTLATNTFQGLTISNTEYFKYQKYLNGKQRPPIWLAVRFVKLGESYRTGGRPDYAVETLSAALPVLRANDHWYQLATAYERLGLAYRDQGNFVEARANYLEAQKLFKQLKVEGSLSVIQELIDQLKS